MTDAVQGAESPAASPGAFQGYGSKGYRAYVLFALVTVYVFNFIDRVVITSVQELIKNDFQLSDAQLGYLGGPTFAILYTLLGIPIARLAEKNNRTTILGVCIGLWSLMTAACGMAVNYSMLLATRIGVSIGEAGGTPPAQSVIADYFPADKRATALGIYSLGVPIGSMLAAVGGGYIAAKLGWRDAFLALGLPGLILAILVKTTIKEPPRAAEAGEAPNFKEAFQALSKKAAFWHAAMGGAAASFTGYGVGQFTTSFFIRTHKSELAAMQLASWMPHFDNPAKDILFRANLTTGLIVGLFGGIGTFASGYIADRIVARYPGAVAWLPAIAFAITTPLNIAGYMTGDLGTAVICLCGALLFQYFYLSSMYAIAGGVVHPRMRATSVAILLFVVNIIGYGAGPPAVGALSDFLANSQLTSQGLSAAVCKGVTEGPNAAACAAGSGYGLRWAIVIGFLGYLWAAAHFLLAWRSLQKDWHR